MENLPSATEATSPIRTRRRLIQHEPMKTYELVSLAVSFVSVISLVVVLWQAQIMGSQTEHMFNEVRSGVYSTIVTQQIELDKLFIEYPELRPYFFDGKEPPSELRDDPKEYNRLLGIATFQLDFFDSYLSQAGYIRGGEVGDQAAQAWVTYIRDSFRGSPVLCRYLSSVARWYTGPILQIAREECATGTFR